MCACATACAPACQLTWEPLKEVAKDETEPLDICGTPPLPANMADGCLNGLEGEHACAPIGAPDEIRMWFGRAPLPPPLSYRPPSTGGAMVAGRA